VANVIRFQEAAVARAYRQIGRSAEAGPEIEELVSHVMDMQSAVKKELQHLILFFRPVKLNASRRLAERLILGRLNFHG